MDDNSSHNTDKELQESAELYKLLSDKQRLTVPNGELSLDQIIELVIRESAQYFYPYAKAVEPPYTNYITVPPYLSTEQVQELVEGYITRYLQRVRKNHAETIFDLIAVQENRLTEEWGSFVSLRKQEMKLLPEIFSVLDLPNAYPSRSVDKAGEVREFMKWRKLTIYMDRHHINEESLPWLLEGAAIPFSFKSEYLATIRGMVDHRGSLYDAILRRLILKELVVKNEGEKIKLRLLPWMGMPVTTEFVPPMIPGYEERIKKWMWFPDEVQWDRKDTVLEFVIAIRLLQVNAGSSGSYLKTRFPKAEDEKLDQLGKVIEWWCTLDDERRNYFINERHQDFYPEMAYRMDPNRKKTYVPNSARNLMEMFGLYATGVSGSGNPEVIEEIGDKLIDLGMEMGLTEN